MARLRRFEWPEGARIAVVLQVAFEQWEQASGSYVEHARRLVRIPLVPKEVVEQGTRDLLLKSWDEYAELGMWRLVELLNKHNVTALGVCNGLAVERYPDVVKAFKQGGGGREICAHSWAQDVESFKLDRELMRANVRRCTDIITKVAGERPVGWVSPGGQHNEHTAAVLAEEGFIWHGDYANTDSAFIIEANDRKIVGMSLPWDVNDLMYVTARIPPSHYVEMFCRSFDVLYEEGGQVLGAVAHTVTYGRPHGIWAYEQVIKYAKSFPKVWFATRREIAEWCLQHCE